MFFKNPKFALSIWWEDLVFGAEVIKILLDPDYLGHIESKSRKCGVFDFPPCSNIVPTNIAPQLHYNTHNIIIARKDHRWCLCYLQTTTI